jgi:hypothetical protein
VRAYWEEGRSLREYLKPDIGTVDPAFPPLFASLLHKMNHVSCYTFPH